MRKENPKELVHEIFARLNQGAVRLSDQEIRHAIYPGIFESLLNKIGDIEFIANFQNSKSKNDRSNEELVLRFFAMQNIEEYEGQLSKWLDKYIKDNQNMLAEEAETLENLYLNTLEKCLRTFEKPFVDTTLEKPRQAIVYYDLIMWGFSNLDSEFIDNNKKAIA